MDPEVKNLAVNNLERRKNGVAETHDFTFVRKNGDNVYVLLTTNPVVENGTVVGAVAMVKVGPFSGVVKFWLSFSRHSF